MSSDNTSPVKPNPAFNRDYGTIWREFLPKALAAGFSEDQARQMHRKWKSVGKRLKAGTY